MAQLSLESNLFAHHTLKEKFMSSSSFSLLTPSKGKTTVSSSSPSPHVARPTAAVVHGQWSGTTKEPEKKWNVSSLSSTLGISSSTPTSPSNYTSSSNKKYQHVQSKLYAPTTASIHNQASPRSKVNQNDDDNMSQHSRFTTSSISPKAVGSPTQDTSRWTKSVLHSVDPISYQYRGSRNVNDSFQSLNGNVEDDSLSVISRSTSASKKYADVPSRLHQPTTASIHSRAVRVSTGSSDQSSRPASSPAVKSAPLSSPSPRESLSSRPGSSPVKPSSGLSRAPDSARHVTSTIQSQHASTSANTSQAPVAGVGSLEGSKFIDIVKVEDELSALNIAPSPKVGASGLRMSKPAVPSFVSVDAAGVAPSTKSVVSDLGSAVGTVGDRVRRATESSSQLLDLEEETY